MHGGGKPTFSLFMDNKTEWWKDFPVNSEKKTLQIEKHVQFSYMKFVRRGFKYSDPLTSDSIYKTG